MNNLQPFETPKSDFEEWCLGWKSTGTRFLSSEELLTLLRETNRLATLKSIYVVVMLLWCFGPALGVSIASAFGFNVPMFIYGAAPIGMMIGGIFLLLVSDISKRYKGRRADLKGAVVKRFIGRISQLNPIDFPSCFPLPSDSNEDKNEGWLEVLPNSQWIYSINGTRPPKPLHAPILKIAASQVNSVSPASQNNASSESFTFDRVTASRPLSFAEKEELTRHSQLIWRPHVFHALSLNLITALLVWALWKPGAPIEGHAITLGWSALVLYFNGRLLQGFRLSLRLLRDKKAGQVMITRPTSEFDIIPQPIGEKFPTAKQMTLELSARQWEILPHSKLIWTADGNPASWRKIEIQKSILQ